MRGPVPYVFTAAFRDDVKLILTIITQISKEVTRTMNNTDPIATQLAELKSQDAALAMDEAAETAEIGNVVLAIKALQTQIAQGSLTPAQISADLAAINAEMTTNAATDAASKLNVSALTAAALAEPATPVAVAPAPAAGSSAAAGSGGAGASVQ